MKKVLQMFGLLMLARVLYLLIMIFAMPYQHIKHLIKAARRRDFSYYTNATAKYFYNKAFSLNQHGNASFYSLFNDLQVTPDGHRFGNPEERLSQVYGINYNQNTLYPLGRWFAKLINKAAAKMGDENHIEKAAERVQK